MACILKTRKVIKHLKENQGRSKGIDKIRFSTNTQRLSSMEKETKVRLQMLDGLRGYFILWIGIFNTLSILQALSPNVYIAGILLLINDKGWFCLCGIFGYSFGLLLQSAEGVRSF
jgi:hypothetical protein